MYLVNLVLFLHIAVVLVAFGISAILHAAEWSARRATTVSELQVTFRVARRLEPLFPVLIAALFGLGAWLIHLDGGQFHYRDGWVATSIVALVLLLGIGGGVLAPRSKHRDALLNAAPNDRLAPELRAALADRFTWIGGHGNTGLALGVVFVMVSKPGVAGSVAVLVVGMGLGTVIGILGARPASVPAAA